MTESILVYDGTTYRLQADAVSDLVARGVIVAESTDGAAFSLSLDHVIEEIEPVATVVERADAPPPKKLGRLRTRGISLFPGPKSDPRDWLPPPPINRLAPDENEHRDD